MSSINDWAAKAARRIREEHPRTHKMPSEERIAAIIATFAEPLMKLLRESKREHGCPIDKQDCSAAAMIEDDDPDDYPCTCGADEWNAKVDAALDGRKIG